jgi:hypothetical protein
MKKTPLLFLIFIVFSQLLISCGGITGRYKNAEIIYNIKSDGTYDFIELELNTAGLSDNEMMLQDYDKLPRKEVLKGSGKWREEGNQIILDGPGLSNEYLIKNGELCTFDVIKNGEVCFEKQ